MALVHDAEYIGTPVNPEYGTNPKNGKPEIRLQMEILEGENKGVRVPYRANTKDAKTISYAKRDMRAAGWQGKTVATFVADVTAANKAGLKVSFTARLASFRRDDGTESTWWTVGSIGASQVPLAAATNDVTKNVDQWFSEADSAGSHPNAPGSRDDSDLPF